MVPLEASGIGWYCARRVTQSGEYMASHPILTKILCVALVASIMLPLGRMIFLFVDTAVSGLELGCIQADLSTSIGF